MIIIHDIRRQRLSLGLTCLMVLLLGVLSLPVSAQTLRIYHIDVEQGDATLLVSPSGQTLLIDSGKNGHGYRLKAVMQQAGVSRIDYFVCTHYHEDHYGGIDELAQDDEISIGLTYDRGDKGYLPDSKLNNTTFREYQETVGNSSEHLTRGETIPLDPVIAVTCIASGGVVLSEETPDHGNNENDMSIALLIQFGDFQYLIGGDIEHTTEGKIAIRDLIMNIDVYQANHHGSHTSSSLEFMEDLSPSVIVISNGNHGGFKHPRQHTLNLFESLDPRPEVFQTNKYLKGGVGGNVDDEHIADLESTETDGTILITVDRTAGNYTVSYRDKSYTFPIKRSNVPTSTIVIESLLPDPVGSDREFEEVSLRNGGTLSVSMTGWTLQDTSGRVWTLVSLGMLDPDQSATIQRNGMPMSLNNSGDEITLLDPSNQVRDRFQYTDSQEGVIIQTGH